MGNFVSQFGIAGLLIFLCLSVGAQTAPSGPSPAPTPSPGPSQQQLDEAYGTGQTSGSMMGTATGESHDSTRPTENANFNSFLQSSINSMMNSQAGRASGQMLESSLTLAAQPYSSSCDPYTITARTNLRYEGSPPPSPTRKAREVVVAFVVDIH